MKQLLEAFKSARKIELLAIVVAVCMLLALWLDDMIPAGTTKSEEERRMQSILSKIEGAGSVDVMLVSDEAGAAQGAVIAATGADEVRVRLRLQQAVHTLTGLELNQIEVLKSKR